MIPLDWARKFFENAFVCLGKRPFEAEESPNVQGYT